jgi:uncharacterized protein YbaR (Trm112 family)
LLERTFAIDVLACPQCGGRLRFLATIEERAVVEKILSHLGLPLEAPALLRHGFRLRRREPQRLRAAKINVSLKTRETLAH